MSTIRRGVIATLALAVAAWGLAAWWRGPPPGPHGARAGGHAWHAAGGAWARSLAADDDGVVVVFGRAVEEYALDGSLRWSAALPGLRADPPSLTSGLALVASGDAVVAVDRSDGSVLWQAEVSGLGGVRAAPAAGVALAGTSGGDLTAFALADGTRRWTVSAPGALEGPPGVGDTPEGTVVAAVWQRDGAATLRVVDAALGAVRWEVAVGAQSSVPAVGGGVVALGDGDGLIRGFAADSGEERWRVVTRAGFTPWLEPAVDGDLLVAVDAAVTVTAVELSSGRAPWQQWTDETVLTGRPVVADGRVYVATGAGRVAAFDRATGRFVGVVPFGGYANGVAASAHLLVAALRFTDTAGVVALPRACPFSSHMCAPPAPG